jgi:hypothetical protein
MPIEKPTQEHIQEMTARMEINQSKLEANRKANQGHMQDILTRTVADRKDDQEKMKDMMESQKLAPSLSKWSAYCDLDFPLTTFNSMCIFITI